MIVYCYGNGIILYQNVVEKLMRYNYGMAFIIQWLHIFFAFGI